MAAGGAASESVKDGGFDLALGVGAAFQGELFGCNDQDRISFLIAGPSVGPVGLLWFDVDDESANAESEAGGGDLARGLRAPVLRAPKTTGGGW